MDDIVENIYGKFQYLINLLEELKEISLKIEIDDYYKKILIVAIASYFESRVSEILTNFVKVKSNNNEMVNSFVTMQAIERKYFTLFNWEAKNVNKFFSMFGDNFKENAVKYVRDTPELDEAIKAFIEINNDRNLLTHNNLGAYSIEKTADEVMEKYRKSLKFIDYIANKLT